MMLDRGYEPSESEALWYRGNEEGGQGEEIRRIKMFSDFYLDKLEKEHDKGHQYIREEYIYVVLSEVYTNLLGDTMLVHYAPLYDEFKKVSNASVTQATSVTRNKGGKKVKVTNLVKKSKKVITSKVLAKFFVLMDKGYNQGIIITDLPLNNAAIKDLSKTHLDQEDKAHRFVAQHFRYQELLFNVTRHVLVPRHVLLSEEEKNVLLSSIGAEASDISPIDINDPVVKYYGWEAPSMIKVYRYTYGPDLIAPNSISYRIIN